MADQGSLCHQLCGNCTFAADDGYFVINLWRDWGGSSVGYAQYFICLVVCSAYAPFIHERPDSTLVYQ